MPGTSSPSRCASAGRQLRVRLTHDEERYLVEEGEPLNVLVRGESHLLSPDAPVAIKRSPK